MNSISINKVLNFAEGSIEVRFNGIPNNDADLEKIDMLLEDFINNHRHNYMTENVSILRTILKDCEEKVLDISYTDEKGSEHVKYDNSDLFLYEKSVKEKKDNYYDRYKIKYEPSYGIKLDYSNHENDVESVSDIKLISKEITEIMSQIYHLKNTKAIEIDIDDKILIEIYKLFYDENPDFTSEDINIKVQTMMSILSEFGIYLDDDNGFKLCGKDKIPLSFDLQQKVNKLYPLGEVNNIEDSVKLAKEPKKIIKIVGETIRETVSNEKNQNESLIMISKIIHAEKHCLPFNSDIKKISEFTERTTNEVESSMKLVKRIEARINKQEI